MLISGLSCADFASLVVSSYEDLGVFARADNALKQSYAEDMRACAISAIAILSLVPRTAVPAFAAAETPAGYATVSAAVWEMDVPGGRPRLARQLANLASQAGYTVESFGAAALTNRSRLNTNTIDLLVIPDARLLPVESVGPIEQFLKQGGDLLACGLTAWESPTFSLAGRWMSRATYEDSLSAQSTERILIDLSSEDVGRWTRHTDQPRSRCLRERIVENLRMGDGGANRSIAALHVTMEEVTGWDTLEPPGRSWGIDSDQTLTCFHAKGGQATRQLAVEWVETDGSRWIATVDLKPEWQRYVLPPDAFRPWEPPPPRGQAGDKLRLSRAARFTLGLAHTHTALDPGPQEFWFAELGVAPNPFGDQTPPIAGRLPRLESLAPAYQVFPITTSVQIAEYSDQMVLPFERRPNKRQTVFPAETGLRGLHPRPRGCGFGQGRDWRWQPLLVAIDPELVQRTGHVDGVRHSELAEHTAYRGAVGALLVHDKGQFAGGVWAVYTPTTIEFFESELAQSSLRHVLARIRKGVFIVEGGAEFFTMFPDQRTQVGATVVNFGRSPVLGLELAIDATGLDFGDGRVEKRQVELKPGERATVSETRRFAVEQLPQIGRVSVTLVERGISLDMLAHEVAVWEPSKSPKYIEAREGRSWLGGEPWKAHGVNYMPSSGIGVVSSHFEYWLGRGAYDPEVIERDLRRIVDMDMNSVSVFVYHRDLDAMHLLDFLRRAERHRIKVNLSLRPGTPMAFRWPEMKALIQHYRLPRNDTVFAYDLAWEPSHYDHAYQQRNYAADWSEWVIRRYGSIGAAERYWGVPAPRTSNRPDNQPTQPTAGNTALTNMGVPPMKQLITDGLWRRLAADYRLFLDQLVGTKYAEARRLVRAVDPHHLVSFRMQHAGDPTLNSEHLLPYDLHGLRQAVDLWEPEAYGRIGDWNQVKGGHFTAAYARLCNPALPLIWAEMGYNVWDTRAAAPSQTRLESAAGFYRDFYRMLRESGADGVFFWWYAGGYRANENSDFGIVEPDGTDRPVTRAIRSEASRFMAEPKPAPSTQWIEIDRDADARGLPGVYESRQADYWRAVEAGERVGLRWAREPGRP